jgi:DNA gyrase subunit A
MTVFQVPEGSRTAKGRAIVNLLQLPEGERIVKLLCMRDMEGKFIVMVTKNGVIKKTDAMEFSKIRSTGIRAVGLNEGDELAFCDVSGGNDTIVIATNNGQGIHFKETEVRCMGRQAIGVRGISLRTGDFVVGLKVLNTASDLLFATSQGYGKRVSIEEFRVAHRGGLGVRTIPTGGRNGNVIGLAQVSDNSEILLIDTNGKVIRLSPQEVRTMGRQAKGVRLVRVDADQQLSALLAFEPEVDENAAQPALSTLADAAATSHEVLLRSPEDALLLAEDDDMADDELNNLPMQDDAMGDDPRA